MTHVGIDPGLKGGLAWLEGPDLVTAGDMPAINGLIDALILRMDAERLPTGTTVGIEEPIAMPSQSVRSTLTTGRNWGRIEAPYEAFGHRVVKVSPRAWKKHFGLSSNKELSRHLAIELWPDLAHLFRLKKHEARAEAALIGRFMHETHLV